MAEPLTRPAWHDLGKPLQLSYLSQPFLGKQEPMSLSHTSQFGAIPGKSTTEAVLCLAHDVHAANNHNLYSLITFDITGYFDNLNHKRLLAVLWDKGIPLPICRWVQAFINSRKTRIRMGGYTDRDAQRQPSFWSAGYLLQCDTTKDVHARKQPKPQHACTRTRQHLMQRWDTN